jgi:lipoprotein NlpI
VRRLHVWAFATLAFAAGGANAQTKEAPCGSIVGNPPLAIETCTRAIEFGSLERPDLAKAYYNRGTEWANQGNQDRAIADFDLALQLDSKFSAAFYNRGLSWSLKGDSDRAIRDYDAALALTPAYVNARIGRAAEYTLKGDYQRAIADYGEALRAAPDSQAAVFGRGRARYYAGNYMAAASDFYRAHEINPAVYTALWLYLARKRADIAGEKTLAHEAGTSGAGPWPAPVVALYLGSANAESTLRSASAPDSARQREVRCEAAFYVAQWHVLRGARDPALQLLREAADSCSARSIEHEGAVAEIRRLQQKP